jgi:hypothetical protein
MRSVIRSVMSLIMDYEEYDVRYVKNQIEYLYRQKSGRTIKDHASKVDVINLLIELNLKRADVEDFFARRDVQAHFESKPWYGPRTRARNGAATEDKNTSVHSNTSVDSDTSVDNNISVDSNTSVDSNDEIEEREAFSKAAAIASGYLAEPKHDITLPFQPWERKNTFAVRIPEHVKARIMARARECADAEMAQEFNKKNLLEVELNGLYDYAHAFNSTAFEIFRKDKEGPEWIYPMDPWVYEE